MAAAGAIQAQHYAFLIGEAEFDAVMDRIRERALDHWADPYHRRPRGAMQPDRIDDPGHPNLRQHATHPNAPKLREMVRGMIERITIGRHESGAIEIGVKGAFAGVMQAAGMVERHTLRTTKVGRDWSPGASLSVVAGAHNQLELLVRG